MKKFEHSRFSPDLSRLIAAAVVSPDFCQTLLQDASAALSSGYHGTRFALSAAEEALVLSIQASTLQDFASQVVAGRAVPAAPVGGRRPSVSTSGQMGSAPSLAAF